LIHETAAGVEVDVRVIPRASKSTLAGERDGRLLVRLCAPPVDGAANDALIDFFATLCGCARRRVRLVAGEKSRTKRVALDGLTAVVVRERLRAS